MEAGGPASQQQSQIQTTSQQENQQDVQTLKQIYEQKLTLLQLKLDQEIEERNQFASKFTSTHQQLEKLQSENDKLRVVNDKLREEITVSKGSIEVQEKKQQEFSEIKSKIESERDMLYSRIEQIQDKYRIQIDELKSNTHDLWSQKSQIEIQRDQLKIQIDQLEKKVQIYEQERETQTNVHKSLLVDLNNMQIQFDKQCEETRKVRRELDEVKTELNLQTTQKQEIMDMGQEMLQERQSKIRILQKEIDELKQQCDRHNLEKLQHSTKVANLENEMLNQSDMLRKYQNENIKLQRDYDACQKLKNMLENQKAQLNNDLQEIKEKYKSLTIARSSFEGRTVINDVDIAKYEEEIKKMFDQQRLYPKEIEKMKAQIIQREDQMREYQNIIKQYREHLGNSNLEKIEVQRQLKQSEQNLISQDNYIQSLRSALEKRQQHYFNIEQHFNCLQEALKSFGYQGEVLKKYDQLAKKFDNVQITKSKEYIQEQDNNYQELLSLKLELEQQQDKIQNYNETIDKLQAELEERDNMISLLREDKSQQNLPGQTEQHIHSQVTYNIPSEQLNTIQRIYTEDIQSKTQQIADLRQTLQKLESENFELQAKLQLQSIQPVFDAKLYVSKDEMKKIEEELKSKNDEVKQAKIDFNIEKGKNNLLQMRITSESTQKQKLENQVKELKTELENEREQLDQLRKQQLDLQTSSAAQTGADLVQELQQQQTESNKPSKIEFDDQQFKELTNLIKQLRDENANLHKQLRSQEVLEVQHETVVHNLNIVIENLNQQVRLEQNKVTELNKVIKFLQSNQNVQDNQMIISTDYTSKQRLDNETSKTINELKELLLVQKDQFDSQIGERDKYIQDLQSLIIENDKVKSEQYQQQETRIADISQQHIQELKVLNTRLAELLTENAQLLAQKEDLQRQIDQYMDEREKLLITDEMKNAELQRLQSIQEKEGKQGFGSNVSSAMDPALIRGYSERIDNIQVSFIEREKEYQVKIQDFELQVQTFTSERKLLNDEIDSLKERETLLKREVQTLNTLLEKVKSNQPSEQESILSQEQQEQLLKEAQESAGQLILRERLNKAESEVEQLRSQLLTMNQKNKMLQSEINKMIVLAEKHAQKVEEMNIKGAQYQHQLKLLEDANQLNENLQEEIQELKSQLEKAKHEVQQHQRPIIIEKQQDNETSQHLQQQVNQLSGQVQQYQDRYDEIQRELTRQQETGGLQGLNIQQVQEATRVMFKGMYGSLQKAKAIILALADKFNIESQNENDSQQHQQQPGSEIGGQQQQQEEGIENVAGQQLGKRQRTI